MCKCLASGVEVEGLQLYSGGTRFKMTTFGQCLASNEAASFWSISKLQAQLCLFYSAKLQKHKPSIAR